MALTMRKAEKKDIEVLRILIEELSGHAFPTKDMSNRLKLVARSPIDSLFVCEENNQILGLLGFRIRENLEEKSRFGEVSAVAVYPFERRKGVGRFMMDYAEKLARKSNCKGMWLVSGFGREEEAHKFYKKLGYEVTSYRFVKLFD